MRWDYVPILFTTLLTLLLYHFTSLPFYGNTTFLLICATPYGVDRDFYPGSINFHPCGIDRKFYSRLSNFGLPYCSRKCGTAYCLLLPQGGTACCLQKNISIHPVNGFCLVLFAFNTQYQRCSLLKTQQKPVLFRNIKN